MTEHHYCTEFQKRAFTGFNDHSHTNIKRRSDGLLWHGVGWKVLMCAFLLELTLHQDSCYNRSSPISRCTWAWEDFLSPGGGREWLPGNAATAFEGGPWAVLKANKICLSTVAAGQKWNSWHTVQSFGLCETNWEFPSSSKGISWKHCNPSLLSERFSTALKTHPKQSILNIALATHPLHPMSTCSPKLLQIPSHFRGKYSSIY